MSDKFEEWLEKEKKALVSADIIPAGEETRTTALMILNRVSDEYRELKKKPASALRQNNHDLGFEND